MEPRHIIDTITDALKAEPAIRALFLSGSHGNGLADQYSDIDFLLIAHEGPSDRIAQLWHDAVALTGDIVLWWDRNVRPALINAITDDWTRMDVVILKPDQMAFQAQDVLKPLFDHDGVFKKLPKTLPETRPSPERLRYQFEEFIRILGLLHLGLGREEHINGVLGVFHLRNLLIDLMITETGTSHRGGMLHLNRLITEEQKQILLSLPPAIADRDALIAANLAYARAYLPRARRLAVQMDVEWPERFEASTWSLLKRTLGIERPYTPHQIRQVHDHRAA